MDFELSSEQQAIQRAAREFAEGEFDREVALELEREHKFPYEIRKKACKNGFIGTHFPEEYGGQGYGILENVLIMEQFCKKDSGIGASMMVSTLGSEIILRFGDKTQKEKYLVPLLKGDFISAAAFTEPDHGSDLTFLSTTATKEGDSYIVNGNKIFITMGPIADFIIVFCQTNPQAKPTYRGQSTIIVEKGSPGFDAVVWEEKMGMKMAITGELSFNQVRVPVENLVGEENRGFYQSMASISEGRVGVSAMALGIAQGAFERALDYAKRREQFGVKIANFQIIQHKLADMATKIEAVRMLTYRGAWSYDHGKDDPVLTSMAKWYAGRVAVEVCEEAIQIFGGHGYLLENEVERFYRDARVTEIIEGTREIQKNTIAHSLIGKLE